MAESRYRVTACRSPECRKAIIWATTKTGKSMPVDAAPAPDGNVLLTQRDGLAYAEVLGPTAAPLPGLGFTLHTSHFATCEFAADWRQRGAAR